MGEPSFLCTTECGSKRRRIESASERLVVSTERTSDKQTGSNGFLGYFIRFLSPVTNLFRPSCRVPKTDVNCNSRLNAISEHLSHLSVNAYTPISEGISKDHGENEIITIDCEDSQLYSSFPTEDGGYPVENINHTFTEEKENNRRMELTATESANIIENKSDKSTETQNWDTHQENSSEDILNLESPSPQPEHSVSQQISPIISPAGSLLLMLACSSISKDRWERRRTSSSNRHISLRRYTPFKNFSVNNKVRRFN
ncbi:unnamed protein product [Thelazia callipaeda]|uniref:Uncharacterized protein n=1 Tax=Thelazia callipaeda TaxID=103827 RepID=A0A0N5D8D3_THECL|nr:unnamed protein product [Thelazia callipaeda]